MHRVLVLDDDPLQCKLIAQMLRVQGIDQVTTYSDGRRALACMDAIGAPELIFCDLCMPHMDGIEFVRELAARQFSGALVLISGVEERTALAAERLSMTYGFRLLGRLAKPFSPDALAIMLVCWAAPVQRTPAGSSEKTYSAGEIAEAIRAGNLTGYYQPKVSVATGEFLGVEALARWLHPHDGMIMPDRFIEVAEKHGLINELTLCMIAEALRHFGWWHRHKIDVPSVAINISVGNLASLAFPEQICRLVAEAGFLPGMFTLEITETQVEKDARVALDVLTRLRLRGFKLSIDDFGTKYSSLTHLRDWPFDQLKIDRGFVHGSCRDKTLRILYDTSLDMARRLGLETVAEGVEDRVDFDLLRRTGCDLAQGYFIAPPMPAEEIGRWLCRWRQRIKEERLFVTGRSML
ncbi:EAL domain-containing response regulator [Brenneria goodwinii]